MEAVFQAPKRRARVYETYEAPLPIPTLEQDATQQQQLVFKAELVNNHVIVRDLNHIQSLYSKVGPQNTAHSCPEPCILRVTLYTTVMMLYIHQRENGPYGNV